MQKRIHIVEDDSDIRYIICYMLTELDYEVKISDSIADYRTHAVNFDADLILMDVMLADGNGLDLCLELKTAPQTKHIPIIMMSAHVTEATYILNSCANDFISKPFDIENLTELIKKFMVA